MSSAYALPLDRQLNGRNTSNDSNSRKSLVLSILMISMSLSSGIIEVNQPTSDLEESPAEFNLSPVTDSISSVFASIAELIWPSDEAGELESSDPLNTGARSTPPSLSLSTSSAALIYGETMDPTITPTNSGGAATSWSITPTLPNGLSFGTSNGTIYGNPTALSPITTYTITATNSFGSDDIDIDISVVQESHIIKYSPNS